MMDDQEVACGTERESGCGCPTAPVDVVQVKPVEGRIVERNLREHRPTRSEKHAIQRFHVDAPWSGADEVDREALVLLRAVRYPSGQVGMVGGAPSRSSNRLAADDAHGVRAFKAGGE